NAGETTRDVLRLRRLARNLRNDVARLEEVAVLDDDVRADREEVTRFELAVRELERLARLRMLEADARAEIRRAGLDDDLAREAGDLVELLDHRDAFDDVAELRDTADLGEDDVREGVPLGQKIACLDLRAVDGLE